MPPPTAPLRISVDGREVSAAPRIEGDSGIAPRIRRRVHVSKDALLGPVQQPVDHLPATEIVFNIHADTDSSQPNKAARLPLPADYSARGQSVLWIDLKIRPDQFSKDDEQVLINTVARILGIKAASIHVFSVEAGSVRCALWLPVVLDLDMVSELQAKLARRPDTRRFRPGKCSVSRHSTDHHTILFFSASPRDQPRIGTEDEFRAIKEGLDRALYGSAFCVQQIPAARWTDLRESLLQYRPSIVHFSAHGTQSGELVLQTLSRNSYVVAANDLAELLGLLRESIRCVVINTCWSAEQAQQIAEKVGCVVCITGPVDDDTAIVFSKVFYSSLAYQDIGVGKAFSLALNDLRMGHFPNADQFQLVTSKETNPDQIVFVTNQTLEAIAVPA